ncbi:MAG: septum formation initiator family protein [Solobacterium sp.]|jgi:cell division protein DivIC|nr:septum formation initiator family protein [Solobacterium sp.]
MTERKKVRKMTPINKLLTLILFCFSGWFLYQVGQELFTMVTLRSQLAEVEAKLQEVKDENNYLVDQKAKLQDPDYVESYARGNYMLSRDGEQIFYLPENEKK